MADLLNKNCCLPDHGSDFEDERKAHLVGFLHQHILDAGEIGGYDLHS